MSFYILELFLNRDLVRKDYYIYNNIEKIKEKLYTYLTSATGCYETVWYGAIINIHVYENYIPVHCIDLHPYIIYELDEYPQIYFDGENGPIAIKYDDSVITKDDAEFDEHFCVKVCNNDETIDVRIDMDSVPMLTGCLLEKQEIFNLRIFPQLKLHYGHNDLEYGNNISDSDSNKMGSDSDEIVSYDEIISYESYESLESYESE